MYILKWILKYFYDFFFLEPNYREKFTLELLKKFKSKLENVKSQTSNSSSDAIKNIKDNNDDDIEGDDWLSHTLSFQEPGAVLAKDASTKSDDWYDVYDPRSAINKRKRGDDRHGGESSRQRK